MDLDFELSTLKRTQVKILETLESMKKEAGCNEIYDLVELQKILKVSRRTLDTWKSEGILPCSQIGKKIYVTKADLEAFLLNHKVGTK